MVPPVERKLLDKLTCDIKMHMSLHVAHNVNVARLELPEAAPDADDHRLCVVADGVTPDGLGIIPGVVVRGELQPCQR